VPRYEAGEGPDLSEQAHLVHLGHHSVQHLPLERPEHDGLVLDGVEDKTFSGLYEARSNVIDACDCDYEAILPCASPFHLDRFVMTLRTILFTS